MEQEGRHNKARITHNKARIRCLTAALAYTQLTHGWSLYLWSADKP